MSSTTTLATTTTTETYVEPENVNNVPVIKERLAKIAVTAGKPFNNIVPLDIFYITEDGTNLKLELLDKYEKPLEAKSWIQFNAETRNIYGLPLEDAVSKWQFKLRATNSANESVFESLDISVQQHKSYRSVNHEIIIVANLLNEFASNVDWEMRLIKGIDDILGDTQSVLVRDIWYDILDPNLVTFIYTNESLPKDICPETQLNEIIEHLTPNALNNAVSPQISIKSIEVKTIGTCSKPETVKQTAPHVIKNYPPIVRNQVELVNATINQLLVFKVPSDTFYDPEDGTDLKLSLLTYERIELDPKYWLQFDSKTNEFFGVPKFGDAGQREHVLVAEDREG
ncbi:dystroglycan-like isoform X2 [Contarinia nasturtii]|nr:dystroglycan-like isoform X2 [Contarinia nasturtii]XP_031640810.1 dystroglycan-like isoform X2 [Contarinia nasturtii]